MLFLLRGFCVIFFDFSFILYGIGYFGNVSEKKYVEYLEKFARLSSVICVLTYDKFISKWLLKSQQI